MAVCHVSPYLRCQLIRSLSLSSWDHFASFGVFSVVLFGPQMMCLLPVRHPCLDFFKSLESSGLSPSCTKYVSHGCVCTPGNGIWILLPNSWGAKGPWWAKGQEHSPTPYWEDDGLDAGGGLETIPNRPGELSGSATCLGVTCLLLECVIHLPGLWGSWSSLPDPS